VRRRYIAWSYRLWRCGLHWDGWRRMRQRPGPKTSSDELDAGDGYEHQSSQERERDQHAGKRIAETKEPIEAFPAPDRFQKQQARKRVQRAPSQRGASVAPSAAWTSMTAFQVLIPGLD